VGEEVAPIEVRFSRELSVARLVSRSLAILMAALVFTLQGSAVGAAGRAAAMSYLLLGAVCSLTLLVYVELLLCGGREGGAYVLLRQATRGPMAFLAGWAIMLGGLLLCAILALGFASSASAIFEAWSGYRLPETVVAALLIVMVAAYNIVGGWSYRRVRDLVTWSAVAVLLLICVLCLPHVRAAHFRPFSSHGYLGIQTGLSLLLVGFLALESIPLTSAEIPRPRRTIPRAFLATVGLGTVLLVVLSLAVAGTLTSADLGHARLPVAKLAEECLGGYGIFLPLLAVVLVPMALNSGFLLVVRQAQVMERDNLLPELLRRRANRFRTPYVLFALVGALGALLALRGDLETMARVGGFCALFLMSMIALGDAIGLRSAGEKEPSSFRLPIPPLVPALTVVLSVFLLPILGTTALLAGIIWLAAGLVIYAFYARGRYIAGKEGVVVFRPRERAVEAAHRVLVPLAPGDRQSRLIKLAVALAGDEESAEVIPLRVITLPAQVPLREGAKMAEGVESVFSWSLGAEDTGSATLTPITRVARSVSQGIIDTAVEEKCDLILLSWEGYSDRKGLVLGPTLDPVVENAPCDVIVVKGDGHAQVNSILLPTSGGPHASIAARLALRLARPYGAQVTVLYVCREGSTAEDREHGREMIARTVHGMGDEDLINAKVITAPGVVAGILAEAQEYDLMFLGASEEGLFDRVLFGTIPQRIARKSPVPVMIAKQRAPLPQFWLRRVWNAMYQLLPTLEAEERSTVYRQIREGARTDIDYFVMITLAATIATLGLLLNSAAVIIGGMLVAPLMSPIIGMALAIALGNVRLLRDAAESTIKGIFLAVVVALFLASVVPWGEPTQEILARTTPNLLDLMIALASGAAGAYAVSRKDVSAALPGVAIAAALVPPLGVVGIGLAARRFAVAGGGMLLFGTNLVGITLAGAVNFLLLGFRPVRGVKEREGQLRRGLVVSMLLLLVVALPLGFVSGRSVQATQKEEVISRVLAEELDGLDGVSLEGIDLQQGGARLGLSVTVYSSRELGPEIGDHLITALTKELGEEVSLRLRVVPVSETIIP